MLTKTTNNTVMENQPTSLIGFIASAITGCAAAIANNMTGFLDRPVMLLNIQTDVGKAIAIGFAGALAGAIGGAVGRLFWNWITQQYKKYFKSKPTINGNA
jgi:hypothetical protein